jgi:hypothetical protein
MPTRPRVWAQHARLTGTVSGGLAPTIPRRNSARVALMFLDNLAAYADVRCSVDLLPERPRDS